VRAFTDRTADNLERPKAIISPIRFPASAGKPVAILERSVCYNHQAAYQEANAIRQTPGGNTMKIRELIPKLQAMDPEGGIFVVVVKSEGTSELFDVHEVRDEQGNAQIEVREQKVLQR
jgi:hypothetical protein